MFASRQKSRIKIFRFFALAVMTAGSLFSCGNSLSSLPTPETIGGEWGKFGIDKNINVNTIDSYLDRSDTVYRDMRMLVDPADFSKVGGDSYLSGFIRGFTVVPYPYLCDKLDLPEEVGTGYQGSTLYSYKNGIYTANYKESLSILQDLFPSDKNIFVMCGAGGYAEETKELLIYLGWNKDKIWNVGCYWSYEGKNNVSVKKTDDEGNVYYAFYLVDYRVIDFSYLTQTS